MRGRPTIYDKEQGDEICERLTNGESLRRICSDDGMPAESTVRLWALAVDTPFSAQYTRAREIGYLGLADELLEIADDGTNDYMSMTAGDDGELKPKLNVDHVARSRLRLDTRKWLLSKMLPKVFGDKITNEMVGKDGTQLIPTVTVNVTRPKA